MRRGMDNRGGFDLLWMYVLPPPPSIHHFLHHACAVPFMFTDVSELLLLPKPLYKPLCTFNFKNLTHQYTNSNFYLKLKQVLILPAKRPDTWFSSVYRLTFVGIFHVIQYCAACSRTLYYIIMF